MSKKNIMNYINDINDRITVDDLYCDDNQLYFEEEDIKIYLKSCSKFIHKLGVVIAGVTKADVDNTYIIYTDNIYDELPQKYQEAFIWHEIGHVMSGSVDEITDRALKVFGECKDITNTREQLMKRDLSYEFAADRYSSMKIGFDTMLKALTYFKSNFVIGEESIDEINLRLKNLRAMA